MGFPKGSHPGATWRKTDLQVHTPRDPQWKGSPHLAGGDGGVEDAKRYQWAKTLLDECIEKSIDAIAITDHHDTCFIEYVVEVAANDEKYASISVFPGMEVTCDDDAQCLVIFDAGTPKDKLERLFGILPDVDMPDKTLKVAPQADTCGLTIADFCSKQAEDTISGISIVLPHGGKDGAHKTLLKNRHHKRFKRIDPIGLYCEHQYSDYQTKDLNKISGQNKEWTHYRKGVISTGDNRDADFSRLGSNPCWIKLGENSAEAIRQALLVDQSRISYEQPELPQHQLLALTVSSSLCGDDFRISFNDGLTALIGGRGAGKSALLEYLRFGLGRSSLDIDHQSDRIERNRELLRETLKEGYVEIELLRNQVVEKWRRDLSAIDSISISTPDGETETILVHEVRDRFRARAFEQGQLSALMTGNEDPESQITAVAAAEHIEQRREIEAEIETARSNIEEIISHLSDKWMLSRDIGRAKSQNKDLKRQLDAISTQMTSQGLSSEAQQSIDDFNLSRGAIEHIKERYRDVSEVRSSFLGIEDELSRLDSLVDSKLLESKPVATVEQIAANASNTIAAKLKEIDTFFLETLNKMKAAYDEQHAHHQQVEALHEQAKTKQVAFKKLIEEKSALDQSVNRNEARIKELVREMDSLTRVEERLEEARKKLESLHEKKSEILSSAATKVTDLSAGSLRANVKSESIPSAMVDAIEAVTIGCNIRDAKTKSVNAVERALSSDHDITWTAICSQLLEISRYASQFQKQEIDETSIDYAKIGKLTENIWGSLSERQLKSILWSISDQHLSDAYCAEAEPFIEFQYKDRNDYIEFQKASPGQQAAAILRLLLHQEAGTLIIDQPEDDLDNKIIADIAEEIQLAKRQRQMIFATHNPNLVVNGDADKIVSLGLDPSESEEDSARINILTDGAIETPKVAKSITEIMEGGLQAFELRQRKYEFL